jgi:hypothetical protein
MQLYSQLLVFRNKNGSLGHPQASVQLVKTGTLYFQCNYDELFPKLKHFVVFIFHHSLIKGHLLENITC